MAAVCTDFLNRGSGMREAIHRHYREVRRIPGVRVNVWWPRHMLDEIQVFERTEDVSGAIPPANNDTTRR